MKPILPLEWEPSRMSYEAWQEIHARLHSQQTTTLLSSVTLNTINNTIRSNSAAILSLEDSASDELTIIVQPPTVASIAPIPVPVLSLEDGFSDELTIIYQTPAAVLATAAQPVMNLEDAAQEDLSVAYPSQLLSSNGLAALPASSTQTQALTGIANKKTSDSTSGSATLTADAALTVTCNETGYYKVEVFLSFYEATLGTGGFQFDLNAGTATIGSILFGSDGFTTAAIANSAAVSASTATQYASVATSSSAPSWTYVSGTVQITVAGTFGMRWAQNTISANVTTLKALSYIMLTKIG